MCRTLLSTAVTWFYIEKHHTMCVPSEVGNSHLQQETVGTALVWMQKEAVIKFDLF